MFDCGVVHMCCGSLVVSLAAWLMPPARSPCCLPQTLIICRHGESEYNKASQETKLFHDPIIFDPHLTPKGRKQVRLNRSLRRA